VSAPHLLHVFSTFVPAGPETRTVQLIEALGREFRHSILAIDGRTDAQQLLTGRAEVRILPSPPRAGSIATLRRLAALFRSEAPDLTLSYNWGAFDAVFAARVLRRPHVHHEDGFTSDEAVEFKRRRVLTRRWFLSGVARVIVPSRKLESIAREQWKLDAPPLLCIPNGIRLERFGARDGRAKLRQRLGIPAEAPLIGYVGHLRPEKNPLRLLAACRALAGAAAVHVLVLGDGPERAGCEAYAREHLAGRVHFAGHVLDPVEHYRALDLFALSSDTEQMPVALLEAMASALPVVSTEVGDVRAILPEEQGAFVVPLAGAATADGLSRALERLLGDSALRARLGSANRARVAREFSFERMLAAYREVYVDALAAARTPR